MQAVTHVVVHHSKFKYDQLEELKSYLNASKMKNNGVLVVKCFKKEYRTIARLKIAQILNVDLSKIYVKSKQW